MKCDGLHCSGCKRGGSSTVAAIVVILLALALGAARHPIAEAVTDVWHVVTIMAEVVAGIVAATVTGLSVYLCVRVTRRVRGRVDRSRAGAVRAAQTLSGPHKRAIGAPKMILVNPRVTSGQASNLDRNANRP